MRGRKLEPPDRRRQAGEEVLEPGTVRGGNDDTPLPSPVLSLRNEDTLEAHLGCHGLEQGSTSLLFVDDPWGRDLAGSFESAWNGAVRSVPFGRGQTGFLAELRQSASGAHRR